MNSPGFQPDAILKARPHAGFTRVFTNYSRKLIARKFHALRVADDTADVLRALDRADAPVIVCLSHASWWDPITALALARELVPSRTIAAPMDRAELQRFFFMRWLGVYGIDPDDSAVLAPMTDYVLDRMHREPRVTLWITPQGRFADVRTPLEIRPGVAAIAAKAVETFGGIHVLSAAIEYAFWEDQRPEVFIRFETCPSPQTNSTIGWHRSILRTMQSSAQLLADRVIARDPAAFTILLGRAAPKIHPLYDAFLKLTRQQRALGENRQSGSSPPPKAIA